jgi:hypothetical protein
MMGAPPPSLTSLPSEYNGLSHYWVQVILCACRPPCMASRPYWLTCTTVAGGKPLKCVLLAAE